MQFFSAFNILFIFLLILKITKGIPNKPKSRIINGYPAAVGQFPWQVILKKDHFDELHCGGSIISSEWVLTAAHCTYQLKFLLIVFGTIHLDKYTSWLISYRLIIHPQYNYENFNNDVSLIFLPQKLTFSETIQAIPLVSKTYVNDDFTGTKAIISGFGYTNDEYLEPSESLIFASVEIMDRNKCANYYGDDSVTESVLCSKGIDDGFESLCTGDSGGPLIAKNSNGNIMQIGIASFVALDACAEGNPSAYSRLTSFLNFIKETIGDVN